MRHFIARLGMCACLMLGAGAALAQSVGKQAQGGDLLHAGEQALDKGQYKVAARNFSKAMQTGDLTNVQVARALYQRGIANEKTGRPADAIADISNALFIEELPGADRAKAYLGRARAYEAVGMKGLARSDLSRARSGGVSEQRIASANAPGGPSFSTSVNLPDSGTAAPVFRTEVKIRKSTPQPRKVVSFETKTRTTAPQPREVVSFETKTRTIAPQPQKVVSFETETRARQDIIPRFRTTIVSREHKAPAPRTNQRAAAARSAAVSAWSTSVAAQATARSRTAATTPVQPPQWRQTTAVPRFAPEQRSAAPRPAGGGSGYRIQIAALRSEAEAQAAWKRLVKKHKTLLAGHQPNIVRTELGGLGTFYRLQLGPFAEKEPSQQLCREFKRGGLDCFLLAP